ncbi:hypothetical protein MPL3365_210087 [Mesorhizobium plurifarium]|uniref:Uncharacterized protein n=1 Tax=Mesorhizobium plurifarium TaxID=69974 RepID=A0A090GAF7_MESPL|nr:hypothetical protein MPL3365_210087 [Mesorhizobium plurifarium]
MPTFGAFKLERFVIEAIRNRQIGTPANRHPRSIGCPPPSQVTVSSRALAMKGLRQHLQTTFSRSCCMSGTYEFSAKTFVDEVLRLRSETLGITEQRHALHCFHIGLSRSLPLCASGLLQHLPVGFG